MAERSKYSDALKISALAFYEHDGRIKQTAEAFNLPYKVVQNWVVDHRNGKFEEKYGVADTAEQIAEYKKALGAEMRKVMQMALKQVVKKLDGANAYQATTIFGILFDKIQIIEGGSMIGNPAGSLTINNTYINQMPDQEAEKLMAKALQRMQGKVIEASYTVEDDQNDSVDSSCESKE